METTGVPCGSGVCGGEYKDAEQGTQRYFFKCRWQQALSDKPCHAS